ncbi:embryonic protein UVS.2-like isoform X2 [Scyliorhinus canicula]|uniref:embryonic protein UVS.2-like isoform X2 n=1 Tax=Scyliorhinus canicula TaxID=7830 RepID=UPI0018F597F0|nr:embryonic protein UVS.2-like isoform X2 [Scyliorhinus canicula]
MHFGKYYLAKSNLPTMVPKRNRNIPIGFAPGLSELDVVKINKLYQCKVCGSLLTHNDGSFTSPNFPALYPKHAVCKWLIRSPTAMKIVLEFDFFHIQPYIGCFRDHLKIYDGSDITSRIIESRSCGKIAPAAVSSQFKILLAFYTDSRKQAKGFSARYRFLHCAKMIVTSSRLDVGNINHEGPDHRYDQSNCIWLIQAHKGHEIKVLFTRANAMHLH